MICFLPRMVPSRPLLDILFAPFGLPANHLLAIQYEVKEMIMDAREAESLARKILTNMAEGGALKLAGPGEGGQTTAQSIAENARLDAVYLASLYRQLIAELQKQA